MWVVKTDKILTCGNHFFYHCPHVIILMSVETTPTPSIEVSDQEISDRKHQLPQAHYNELPLEHHKQFNWMNRKHNVEMHRTR